MSEITTNQNQLHNATARSGWDDNDVFHSLAGRIGQRTIGHLPAMRPISKRVLARLVDEGPLVAHELEPGEWYASLALLKLTCCYESWPDGIIVATDYGRSVARRQRAEAARCGRPDLTGAGDSAQASPSAAGAAPCSPPSPPSGSPS